MAPTSDQSSEEGERLLDRDFVVITGSALAYFIAIGILIPVLPHYVEDELGGSGLAIGIAVGAFAVSAALLRPAVGRIGDQQGRRLLVLGGGVIAAVSILGYELATTLPALVGMRLLTGVGEAAVFVGAATAVQDLAPPTRRGEAASYFSVAVYGGLGLGPVIGEKVRAEWGFDWVWLVAGLTCALCVVIALGMPEARPPIDEAPTCEESGSLWRRFFHPAAVGPGVVLALSAAGYAAFSAFVPLYVEDIDLSDAGAVFAEYAAVVLAVRILGARLPDRLGSFKGSGMALVLQAAGFAVMAAWATQAGLYVAAFIYALGSSLLYPALFPLVIDGAPEAERSQSVATFTLFFDVSQGLGAPLLGIVKDLANERAAFAVAGGLAVAGLVVVRGLSRSVSARLMPAPQPP